MPLGDYISLMTSSLESLRRLEVILPLLQLSYDTEPFIQMSNCLKKAVEAKLQSIESGNGLLPNFDIKEVERLVNSFSNEQQTSSKVGIKN
jgi:hypothetical protein